ncbi:DEAD/DEAH box helicase [Clostridium felsineum]|uniref:DEAD-box ATP-dependent RNA helicase CshE n=1 Tax=Clostridium felsineum TaxID=36839 RepID=A0A1S8M8N7_9CLOT|nr:DEAD/DEAH box helicase [Clostridium felsineum]MCR3760177.1 DEAD/DEAH box helicase [Clostridium felsineum]URZ01577.1 DEAD-box ATP-dependent RNA helicase CshE [Clostridium felsineum]URZ05582.1 DEAD-box ATP-dependent RNA helicase CshE [Clostridium felsineum]URZ10621.1 DEAD-box ATP-dependent RNA helicase CshE [Clostridium felsineum]URZ17464.1 DEAD-box ATP-dependent RNA helicase CshE [Clostridium felsineum DSM 794]
MNFKKLGISEALVKVLKKNGITEPTPVQAESINHIKGGRDAICEAQTGTGKTLAFLLPIFENISPDAHYVQALIVTPTRELALQITEEAKKLKEAKDVNILAAYGGKDISSQLKKLKGNTHLIIATPGRLLDHIQRKTINLSKLKTFVLDEADQMLLMGFKNDIETILKCTPKKLQTLCFSATISPDVKKLAYRYMKDPLTISTKKQELTLETIKQFVVETTDRKKLDALCTVLKQDNPFMAIIFGRTKRRVDELEVDLYKRGFDCQKIHSDLTQTKREKIMKSFRNGDFQYLLATDVASRGLDISGVSHIYNYDMPENPESYIHRIGRTGRAGEDGYTCLFATERDKKKLADVESTIKSKLPRREL